MQDILQEQQKEGVGMRRESIAGSPSFAECYTLEMLGPNGQRHGIFKYFNSPFCHLGVFHPDGPHDLYHWQGKVQSSKKEKSRSLGSADEASKIGWFAQ